MQRMDGYIRVSRVAGREGERFISPADQRKKIEAWADLHGVEIVEWWEEVDQSGAKLERPKFQEALARCERGETGGIVVARLDRFARSAVDALQAIKRLNTAGARLASVEDGFDGSTAMGRFAIGILLLIAELELERIRDSWSTSVSEAIGRGVYISAIPPTGYLRNEDGRLEIDPVVGPLVREAFRLRAGGAAWRVLGRLFEQAGAVTPRGNGVWTHQTVRQIIHNRAYLGEARQGEVVNRAAHEPLVTAADWEAAQLARSVKPAHAGSIAGQALLRGLLRCAGCAHRLVVTGSGRGEKREPIYYCKKIYATGVCPAPASAKARRLDSYLEQLFVDELRASSGIVAEAVAAEEEIEQELAQIVEAERDLDAYLANVSLLRIIGEGRWNAELARLQSRLDSHRSRLAEFRSRSSLLDELTPGDLLQAWQELVMEEKRKVLHGFIDRIVVRRQNGGRKVFDPQRVQVIWHGNVVAEPAESVPVAG